ncbi:MAG: helix-turn-helix domain-containing protein [Arenibacterium sp.]
MTENADDILTLLPARLKEARLAQGLSLEAVSNLSGVSRSMVSQIERGESSPTISTLWNLTRALQVDFAGLLDTDSGDTGIELVRASAAPRIDNMGQGCRIRILSPPEEAGQTEIYELVFETNGALRSAPHRRGAREQLTVIEGALQVVSGAHETEMKTGDTARYAADVPHQILALNGPARAFLVVRDA